MSLLIFFITFIFLTLSFYLLLYTLNMYDESEHSTVNQHAGFFSPYSFHETKYFIGFLPWSTIANIYTTWSHKNTYLCALSLWHRFMYLTARFAAVSKRNVQWVALKHRLNTWTLAHFYYVDIGTYCCVFITLLQKCIAAVQNSNIRGLSLKVNALLCWKYALHQTQP